ncbi:MULTISPECIES: restriction endonuclease subunit S [Desulfovibrio]|uniref:restriction endonuclease subunit S n=1 Tax=Desulfovibrio TaxID=872 RepID=UPI0026F129E8|nr:restriction endonuclease subunit S [Desulfovibrio piger]
MAEMESIGELCQLINGYAFKSSDWSSEGTPIVRIQNLNNILAEFNYFNGELDEKYYIDNGTLLFSWSGTPGTSFGAFIWNRGPAIINQHIFRVITKKKINTFYLKYALNGKLSDIIAKSHGGVGLQHITKKDLEKITILVPSLDVQNKIVMTLNSLENILEKRKQQLSKLDQLVKSRFIEMFGDPVINTKKFPVFRMDEVVKFVGGSQPDKKYFEYSPTPDNIRLIQIRDYKSDKFITYIPKSMAKRHCTADDIMIGRYGPPIFQILQGIEGSYNVALMKAVPLRGNKEFIRYFLKQDALLHYLESLSSRTAGQDGIQMDKLKEYPFPFPPLIDQETFVTFTKQVEKAKSSIKQSLEKLETLKKSLMQEYFG